MRSLGARILGREARGIAKRPCCHAARTDVFNLQSPAPSPRSLFPRSGITLIEVLISMFVLLFGLMGVAAIFPVASHYILEGDKRDRSSGLAQLAFEELQARKVLRPRLWLYANSLPGNLFPLVSPIAEFVEPIPSPADAGIGPGHAFVIDPLGAANAPVSTSFMNVYPTLNDDNYNPWLSTNQPAGFGFAGIVWPVRRMTLPQNGGPLGRQTADTIFRLRDDLAVEQPDAGDRPSIQRWAKADPNGTPSDPTDDQLLSRDYTGDYSWLATVVPTNSRALMGLQPAANIKDGFYEVTTVVFYKRDIVPSVSAPGSPGSERLIAAEFLNESELALYSPNTNVAQADAEISLAVDGIKPTNWIAVMGVNQITGTFMMKWYKIQAMDDESTPIVSTNAGTLANGRRGRYVMVQGADWPKSSYNNLQVAILPGAIDAYTRVMQVDVE